MRTEEIGKEARLYNGEDECYVHIEKCTGQHMRVITNGSPAALMTAGYVLILEIVKSFDVNPYELLKQYKKSFKKYGDIEVGNIALE